MPFTLVGVPAVFPGHATRGQLVEELRLRAEDIARDVLARLRAGA